MASQAVNRTGDNGIRKYSQDLEQFPTTEKMKLDLTAVLYTPSTAHRMPIPLRDVVAEKLRKIELQDIVPHPPCLTPASALAASTTKPQVDTQSGSVRQQLLTTPLPWPKSPTFAITFPTRNGFIHLAYHSARPCLPSLGLINPPCNPGPVSH